MPAEYARLQQVITINSNMFQDKRDAIDAGKKTTVVVQVNVLSAATAGTLFIQHSAVLEDNQFEDHTTSVSLSATGPKSIVLTGHTRFLRWRTASMNGSATFLIDTIGRE